MHPFFALCYFGSMLYYSYLKLSSPEDISCMLPIESWQDLKGLRHVIDLKGLEEILSGIINLPEGELHVMCTFEEVIILMWSFNEYVGCKSAGRDQFVYVGTDNRLYEFDEPCTKASVSLPFLCLKINLVLFFMMTAKLLRNPIGLH